MWNRLFSRQSLQFRSFALIGVLPTCCVLLIVLLMGVRWRRRGDPRGNYVILAAVGGLIQTVVLPQIALILVYHGPFRIWSFTYATQVAVHGSILVAWCFSLWAVVHAVQARARMKAASSQPRGP
jgi:hypothetical protein